MKITRPRLALVGAVGLVALSGCGGGGGSEVQSASGSVAARDDVPRPATDARAAAGTNESFDGKAGHASTVVEQQAVIKNGDISVTTTDPQGARDRVDDLLTRLHGTIDDEQTVYDKQGAITESRLVLRVPVATFSTAMDDIEHLGKVVHSSSNAKDVTTEVIDVQQRLKTLRISLHDLNSFQQKATTIDQLLRFETAITQRRGQYQSLKAQRDHLVDQTSMSTIDVDISVPATPAVTPVSHHEAGFGTGLRHGWSALTRTLEVTLTAVGAALPFAVVLAALGLPLWWVGRRAWRAPPGPAADAPTPE
jgi:uncharacterized protein DUF4349